MEPTNSGVSHRSAKLVYILCGALLCMRLEVCNIFQLCFTALKAAQINCPNARNGVRAHVSVCASVCVSVRKRPVGATKKCQSSPLGLPERPVSTFVIYL